MTDNIFREARLIVPGDDHTNRRTDKTAAKVRTLLVEYFNGYTETLATGAYVMPDGKTKTEMVHIFDVAVFYEPSLPETGSASRILRTIARVVLDKMDQEAVYLRHANGTVEFVKRAI